MQRSNPDLDPTYYYTRNYLSTLDRQSFNNRVYYSEGIVFRVPNLCAAASSINKQPPANLVQGEEEKAQASFAKFPHKKICEVLESII
jgi:hypothetical protein